MSGVLGGLAPGLLLAENSFIHLIGEIFHPVFVVIATVLAAIYSVVPNYAISIVLLTILIMAVLTPLTVKSTKSMIQMQSLQPEIKRLQQKYKGPENREQLSQEMMRLYKERGVNPAGSCLPMFLQMPFLFVLYDVIKGLSNTVKVHGVLQPQPRYIPTGSRMHADLIRSHGRIESFGMNLALKPFSHHAEWYAYIPFFALVVAAVVLQYVQMSQMTKRNPAAAQANPGMQRMQKIMPVFFAYIYFLIPAAVVIYMIVSTAIRIGTQDVLFRTGIVQPAGERVIPGSGKSVGSAGKGGAAKGGAISAKSTVAGNDPKRGSNSSSGSANGNGSGSTNGTGNGNGSRSAPAKQGGNRAPAPARKPAVKPGGRSPSSANRATGNGNTDDPTPAKSHPRAKNKRTRKAR